MSSAETPETRLKRLRMRSWRRGMKEMDLILGPFSDSGLKTLSEAEFSVYEAMLEENDQELFLWFSGRNPAPVRYSALIDRIMTAK